MLIKDLHTRLKSVRGAIHVGAHLGEEREWYKAYGFTKVLWFEPNKELFPQLEANLEDYPNQIAFNLGIHDTLNSATLHISSNNAESSSILDLGTHKKWHPEISVIGKQEIRLIRADNFLIGTERDIEDFNFLNVDVEGTELNVIKSFGDLIGKFDYIYSEIHTDETFKGNSLLPDVDAYLLQYGFKRVATRMHTDWGDCLYVKNELI